MEHAKSRTRSALRILEPTPVAVLAVAVLYAAVGKLGQLTTTLPGQISPIFPSAGIALAAVLILGRRALLGVWLGSLVFNAILSLHGQWTWLEMLKGLPLGCMVALGAMSGAGAGAYVVRRLCKNQAPLGSGRNVLVLLALGAVGCCAVSPTVGVFSLAVWGLLPWHAFGYSWLTWWLGDATGAIIVAPLILAWHQPEALARSRWRVLEVSLLAALMLLLCRWVFFGNHPFEYGLMPLLLWAAFRHGMRGASSTAAAIAIFATIGTSRGSSPFVGASVNHSLLLLHSFLAVTIICALVLAGVLAERRQMEAERSRLATAVQQAADAIVITDTRGTILYVNPAFERITGYPQTEAVGQSPRLLKSGVQDDAFYRQLWDTLGRGEVWSGRIVNQRKKGTRFDADMSISPIRDATGTIRNYVAVQHDVTQQMALEARLRQAQKMESIGQLAGGVAHDFNNILTVIQGHAGLLLTSKLDPDQLAESSREILHASERAAGLTRQLLLFGRAQATRPVDLDLNDVVRAMIKMLERLLGAVVTMHYELAPTALLLRADGGMVEQVLLNLAVNARDAMPGGGRLTISTGSHIVDDEQARQNPEATAGRYVWLDVADTGQGINPDVLPRIFEPFFTTKEVGKGTGLGLATVHGIVKQHRGWISVHSQPGEGAAFRVWLPSIEASDSAAKEATTAARPGGTETVLLVEDEAPLRLLVSDVLRRCGYTVLVADTGVTALDLWRQSSSRIDLLFTDLVMPGGVSGLDLASRLRAEKPELKVLFTSGYRPAGEQCPVGTEGEHFLQKPYLPEQLVQIVRSCLDGKSSAATD